MGVRVPSQAPRNAGMRVVFMFYVLVVVVIRVGWPGGLPTFHSTHKCNQIIGFNRGSGAPHHIAAMRLTARRVLKLFQQYCLAGRDRSFLS